MQAGVARKTRRDTCLHCSTVHLSRPQRQAAWFARCSPYVRGTGSELCVSGLQSFYPCLIAYVVQFTTKALLLNAPANQIGVRYSPARATPRPACARASASCPRRWRCCAGLRPRHRRQGPRPPRQERCRRRKGIQKQCRTRTAMLSTKVLLLIVPTSQIGVQLYRAQSTLRLICARAFASYRRRQ